MAVLEQKTKDTIAMFDENQNIIHMMIQIPHWNLAGVFLFWSRIRLDHMYVLWIDKTTVYIASC